MKETKFKQTEVGMIPSDWEVHPLNFIVDFFNGDRGVNYPKDSDFCDAGVPFINAGHLKNCQIDFSCMDYITYEHYKRLGGAKIKKNDILFCLRGSLGKYAYVNFDNAAPASSLCVLRSKKVDAKYLFQLLGFEYIKTQIIDANSGSSQPNLSAKDVGNFKVLLPPTIKEQQRIANALSDVDTLIANLEKLIAKKKNIKQGAMQQLLTGRKRLPGFAPAKPTYKQTELGMIPTDWESINLGSIADIRTGKRNGEESETFGKYPFFVRSRTVYRINSYSFDGEAILIPGEGGIGSIFHYINGKFDYHQRVYKISDFSVHFSAKYLFYFMKRYFGPYAMTLTVKATVDSLRLPTFENFVVWYPPSKTEQTAIANILSDMDTEIATLETKLAKYRKLKTGMMQQLLTGKVRLV